MVGFLRALHPTPRLFKGQSERSLAFFCQEACSYFERLRTDTVEGPNDNLKDPSSMTSSRTPPSGSRKQQMGHCEAKTSGKVRPAEEGGEAWKEAVVEVDAYLLQTEGHMPTQTPAFCSSLGRHRTSYMDGQEYSLRHLSGQPHSCHSISDWSTMSGATHRRVPSLGPFSFHVSRFSQGFPDSRQLPFPLPEERGENLDHI